MMLCELGQTLQNHYQKTALDWGTQVNRGSSKDTVERLEWEHSRAVLKFTGHKAVCSRCREASILEASVLKLLAA
jgi:hypothetical protein